MSDLTLMGLWGKHKRECRPVGDIVADARAGRLPGVREIDRGHGYRVINEQAALAALKKDAA